MMKFDKKGCFSSFLAKKALPIGTKGNYMGVLGTFRGQNSRFFGFLSKTDENSIFSMKKLVPVKIGLKFVDFLSIFDEFS